MKHTDIKAFVRKYNSEFAIRGYSKMRKADLLSAVTTALSRSRKEIKAEWKQMKGAVDVSTDGSHRSTGGIVQVLRYARVSLFP